MNSRPATTPIRDSIPEVSTTGLKKVSTNKSIAKTDINISSRNKKNIKCKICNTDTKKETSKTNCVICQMANQNVEPDLILLARMCPIYAAHQEHLFKSYLKNPDNFI